MNAHRPLPRVRSIVLPEPACGDEVSTAPGFGSALVWGATAEADTLIRHIDADLQRRINGAVDGVARFDSDDGEDDGGVWRRRVWRRRVVVRGSERAVPLPAG